MEFFQNWWWVLAVILAILPVAVRMVNQGPFEVLNTLDRRWVFLYMMLAVAIPILQQWQFPEKPTLLADAVFDEVEKLQEGDAILMAFDYDPASEGELGPMATAAVYQACRKKLKICFTTLWPAGTQMIDDKIRSVIEAEFGDEYVYGRDYVNLGFKAGDEGVIKVIVTDMKQLYTTDHYGTAVGNIPMMDGLDSVQDFALVFNVSAGYPGTKEWVLYGVTPFEGIKMVAGCTGVQAPLLYPYIPEQLPGLLAAIKGASEYEKLVMEAYPVTDPKFAGMHSEARRRMGPQLIAHVLIIVLIVVGNVIFFVGKRREVA